MRITTARRIAQGFFFALFVWLCVVSAVGTGWSQWRGWPIRWFLQLDPLVALGTVLTTHSLYPALGWALGIVALTLLFGRVFCGWLCPFGALHQFTGWLARLKQRPKQRMQSNEYHPAQTLKYYLLAALLAAAVSPLGGRALASLQTGLLDPIPLVHRSVNLAVLSLLGAGSAGDRFYTGAGLIGLLFLGFVLLNLVVPRFYCRFLCPLGALLGVLGRFAPWGISVAKAECTECRLCDRDCEGACRPSGPFRASECLMCMNCMDDCPTKHSVGYAPRPSPAGEIPLPEISRRGFLASVALGLTAAPLTRLGGATARNWPAGLIRPPGAVSEEEFLARCVKCCECVRVCPTNAIQPAGFEFGWEALLTPAMNYRIGTSGCQLDCIACGHACPTGAIRPLSLEEKRGGGSGGDLPIRLGLASVDRGRCLPWATGRPCIVCEETCPVSPKAITVDEIDQQRADGTSVRLQRPVVDPSRCIGCGVCEHECPLSGMRGIRVVADNESRQSEHSVLLRHEN